MRSAILLLGVDAFSLFAQWRDAARVVSLAHLVVLTRATGDGAMNGAVTPDSVSGNGARHWRIGRGDTARPRSRRIDVSSTEIRARAREGRPIRGFVTDAVAQYIESNGLYR